MRIEDDGSRPSRAALQGLLHRVSNWFHAPKTLPLSLGAVPHPRNAAGLK